MKKLCLLALMLLFAQVIEAQNQTIKGTVVDAVGEPLIGARVKVSGTSQATVTDLDGNFTLSNVPEGAKIDVSCFGMKTKTITASQQMNVSLEDDAAKLDEAVVIGYGTAKAKDLTSPITVVRGEELLNVPTTSPMAALQGKVAGVNIINNGQPGAGPTVRIRGIGSFSNAGPLYVVDGMFYDNINFLNTSDIKDISFLKDASAAAIYGVRAANGVVIVTTKKGARGQKTQINYEGYVGVQSATNVLKMANSSQYATMLLEANYDAYKDYMIKSIDRYGGSYADPDFHNWTYGSNTDWYNQMLRSAAITNHGITISGGTDRASYSTGMSYLYQDGIMDTKNNYSRLNFRGSLDYDATDWLKVGFNGVYSKSNQTHPNNDAWQEAFNAPGLYPIYDPNNADATPEKFADPGSVGYLNNFFNPIASVTYFNSKNENERLLSNFYADFSFIPNKLNFKTSVSYEHTSIDGYVFRPSYYVGLQQRAEHSNLTKSFTTYNNYVWDNTLNYNESWNKHSLGAMLGYSIRQEKYHYLAGTAQDVPEDQEEFWYIGQGTEASRKSSESGSRYRGQSYFTRLSYNYDSKYYLMFTFRADGSSKYNEKWGYFPSVGASWVVSEEPFFKNNVKDIDFLKVRASWGQLGNDKVAASAGKAGVSVGDGSSGVFNNTTYPGFQNTGNFSWIGWELVEETNIGFSLGAFERRLNLEVDYFHRMTKDAVLSPRLPFENATLMGNHGKVLNSGFDISATWNDRIGDRKSVV